MHHANEHALAGEGSEGELNDEEEEDLEHERGDQARGANAARNRKGEGSQGHNSIKSSINNLPQMTIINLNQMQSKQKYLKSSSEYPH